ncbi:MAG: hypothetical protein RL011_212 [Pseudomonadota bacterium]
MRWVWIAIFLASNQGALGAEDSEVKIEYTDPN